MLIIVLCLVWCTGALLLAPQEHSLALSFRADGKPRCIYTEARHPHDRVVVRFESLFGGRDFSVQVVGPQDSLIFDGSPADHEHDGKIFFESLLAGDHAVCVVPKTAAPLMVRVGISVMSKKRSEQRLDALGKELLLSENSLNDLIRMQEYMRMRMARHRETLSSNWQRALLWWVVGVLFIVGTCAAQTYFLQRIFRKKSSRAA